MTTNSILNVFVTYYRNYTSTEGVNVDLMKILTSHLHKGSVRTIRAMSSKEERDKEKRLLPAFTPSGIFRSRNDNGLITHSGLIAIDIDFKDNKHLANFFDLKTELSNIENIAYCGLSVSGRGFWALIPISQPDLHRQHFNAIASNLREYGLTIDSTGCNLSRLRGVSYDSDAYFNHDAVPHKLLRIDSENKDNTRVVTMAGNTAVNVNSLVRQIQSTGIDITDGYDNWFSIGCCIANAFGEQGRHYFHEISKNHPKYDTTETDQQFDQCLKGRYNYKIETFFHHCARLGLFYKNVG